MSKRILDSESRKGNAIKTIMGERIKKARNAANFTRDAMAKRLNSNKLAPIEEKKKADFSPDRLRQWEYGNNAVPVEWIPAICDVLDVDVGYLFGDYEEYKRVAADMVHESGLSEAACEKLREIKSKNNGTGFSYIISILAENPNLEYFLVLLGQSISFNMASRSALAGNPMLEVDIDGTRMVVQKHGLIDSVLQSHILQELPAVADLYRARYTESPETMRSRFAEFHNALVDRHASGEIDGEQFDKLESEWLNGGNIDGND